MLHRSSFISNEKKGSKLQPDTPEFIPLSSKGGSADIQKKTESLGFILSQKKDEKAVHKSGAASTKRAAIKGTKQFDSLDGSTGTLIQCQPHLPIG